MVNTAITAMLTSILSFVTQNISNLYKIKNTIKLAIQRNKKYPKIEKNAILLAPFPIVKSSKGYIYYPENKKKLFCGKCYVSPSNLTPLENIGFKKYVCPACKTKYKV